jgi:hypothetical protein
MTASASTVIYADDFNFSGAMHGRTPTTTTGGATWNTLVTTTTPNTDPWSGNGTSVNSSTDIRSAMLPFTPVDGYIYELSVKMSGASTATSSKWISVGFGLPDATTSGNFTSVAPNGGNGTMILRENGAYGSFTTRGGTNNITGTPAAAVPSFTAGTFYDYKVVLDTSGANWVTTYHLGGNQVASFTWSTDPSIGYVMLTSNTTSGSARFDDFLLTAQAVPEPASVALCGLAGMLALSRRRRG